MKNIIGNEIADRAAKDAHGNMKLEIVQVAVRKWWLLLQIGLRDSGSANGLMGWIFLEKASIYCW